MVPHFSSDGPGGVPLVPPCFFMSDPTELGKVMFRLALSWGCDNNHYFGDIFEALGLPSIDKNFANIVPMGLALRNSKEANFLLDVKISFNTQITL